jgi:hypothetical protein
MIATLTGPAGALAAAPELIIPLLAWIAAGAGLWLRATLPPEPGFEEAAAAAVVGYGVM